MYIPITQATTSIWQYLHTICIIDNGTNTDLNVQQKDQIFDQLLNFSLVLPKQYQEIYNKNLYMLYSVDYTKSMALFNWSVDLHNLINQELNKSQISYEDAITMYCNTI